MKLTVVHLEGSKQGLTETLTGQVITVGRDPSNTLSFDPFKDLDVSSRHASISVQGTQVMFQDLGSTNGTFLNGSKITGAVPLPNGCMLQFGDNGPKLQVTWSLDEGPGKKTKMIHDLSSKLDEAGVSRKSEKKRNLIILLVVLLIGTIVGISYGIYSSGVATEKLTAEVTRIKKRAKDQREQASIQGASKTKAAKANWDSAEKNMKAGEAAEKAEDLETAKQEYESAADAYQKAGTAANNAALLAIKGQLEEANAQANATEDTRDQKDVDDRKKLESGNAAALEAIRKQLEDARKGSQLLAALENVDLNNPEQIKAAIAKIDAALPEMSDDSPEKTQLGEKLTEFKEALERLANVGERLKVAAEAAKAKTVAVRSHVFAIPKGQRLDTTKIRITVARGLGSGFFAAADGRVIASKEAAYPEIFDPKAAALKSLLEEKGMQFFWEYEVLTPRKKGDQTVYEVAYGADKVSVARRPDDEWGDKEKVTIRFDNADKEVTVRTHKRGSTDVVVLKVDGIEGVEALELATGEPREGLPLAVLGIQKTEDGEALGLFRFDGKIKALGGVLTLEVPAFSTWIGGPVIDPDGKVVGVLSVPDLKESKAVSVTAFRHFIR